MSKRDPNEQRIHAIVPVNVFRKSKDRLSMLINPMMREQLSKAMLTDVLIALQKSKRVGEITLVSADEDAKEFSRRYNTRFIPEGKRRGLNGAIRLALSEEARRDSNPVLIIHADLPLLKAIEIDRLLAEARNCPIVIGPSKDGRGTNAIYMKAPRMLKPSFGRGSFNRHVRQARKNGLQFKVSRIRGIGFDVDLPKDLRYLNLHKPQNHTGRFLDTVQLQRRFNSRHLDRGIQ